MDCKTSDNVNSYSKTMKKSILTLAILGLALAGVQAGEQCCADKAKASKCDAKVVKKADASTKGATLLVKK